MNNFIKAGYLSIFAFALFLDSAHAQLQYTYNGIVKKEALIVYMICGENILIPKPPPIPDTVDSQGNIIKRFSVGSVEDCMTHLLLPNDRKLYDGRPIPLAVHYRDLVSIKSDIIYPFNDVYITHNVMANSYIYRELGLNPSDYDSPTIDMNALKASNDVFIWYRKSHVGKFWVLTGEWEEFEMTEKPQILRGLTRLTLQFDTYRVYLLKKIISIEPVTQVVGPPHEIQAVKGLIPTTKPQAKN